MYFVYQFWTNFLAYFVALTLTPGIYVQDGLKGYFISGAVYVALVLIIPRIIEFFKINVNIWSFILVGSLFSTLYFYLMRYFFVGFLTFEEFPATRSIFGLIKGVALSESQVIIFAGIFTTILIAVNQWINDK